MLTQKALPLLLFSLLAGPIVAQPIATQGIQWRHDLYAAKQEAAQSGKLVLLHFWSTSCGPCMALEKQVFNQQAVATSIESHYVPVKVNPKQAEQLAKTYGVTRIPTDVILSPEGNVIRRTVSPATPIAYVAAMKELATSYAARPKAAYQAAISQAPYATAMNNAYAGLELGPQPVADGAPAAQPGAPQAPQAGVVENQHASETAAAQPGRYENPYVASPAADVTPVASQPVQQQLAPPLAPQPNPAAPPSGSPPIGFDGYCTVSMMRDFAWKKGDPAWGAIHRGRTYLFAGEAERDEFMKTPDKYSPVLSGLDAVAAVEQNQAVPGKRKFALQYPSGTGQFYLFSTAENLKKFAANPGGFAEGVRQAMSTDGNRLIR